MSLGLRAIKRLIADGDALAFHNSKLSDALFRGEVEKSAFSFVATHLKKYGALPNLDTALANIPEMAALTCPEPAKYYLDHLNQRFAYDVINEANIKSQSLLKEDQSKSLEAENVLMEAVHTIRSQRMRHRILDFNAEGHKLVHLHYYQMAVHKNPPAIFGWEYMDRQSGSIMPGDVISIVGRPAMGKSFMMLYMAIANWRKGRKVLFVSMEMNILSVAQRTAAMFAGTNLTQLKTGGYSSHTYQLFSKAMAKVSGLEGKLYIVDGNLAATVDEIFSIAAMLKCEIVVNDGAYLNKHRDRRLDRYARVAENVELMKQYCTELEVPVLSSWQLNRQAEKKKQKGEKTGLEDIGYSDAIGQTSSIVLALLQEEGIETLNTRVVDVIKGRSGEVGQFKINWKFDVMDFTEVTAEDTLGDEDVGLKYL